MAVQVKKSGERIHVGFIPHFVETKIKIISHDKITVEIMSPTFI